jgi:UDP-GlcNAc3NAcA epimerase
MHVLTVVGARPQFVKAATVSRAIAMEPRGLITQDIIHTGQHYDDAMSAVFFAELGIPTPSTNLGVGSGGHGFQTGRMMEALETLMLAQRPDWVLVYGDTNSTLAGALTACKLHIPVAHVEAGLRSFNKLMPEEVNRIVTDHVSDVLFVPTETARKNLRNEGLPADRMALVGDVMYDAALHYGALAAGRSTAVSRLGLTPYSYLLCTVHRAENTDNRRNVACLFAALLEVAELMPIVVPLHPRTRSALGSAGIVLPNDGRIRLIEPVSYLDMTALVQNAHLVVTDSGGLQKEAFFHRRPCITLRAETEWVELVDLGWNRLVPPSLDATAISSAILEWVHHFAAPPCTGEPYGQGNAAEQIVAELLARTGVRTTP